jgi:hypothetical protein
MCLYRISWKSVQELKGTQPTKTAWRAHKPIAFPFAKREKMKTRNVQFWRRNAVRQIYSTAVLTCCSAPRLSGNFAPRHTSLLLACCPHHSIFSSRTSFSTSSSHHSLTFPLFLNLLSKQFLSILFNPSNHVLTPATRSRDRYNPLGQ